MISKPETINPPSIPRRDLTAVRDSLATVCLCSVIVLFAAKYLARLQPPAFLLVGGYCLFYYAVVATADRFSRGLKHWSAYYYGAVLLFAVGSIVVLQMIDARSVDVDRWYMIDLFWTNVQADIYPYLPTATSNIPGPLPMYYVFALPFYVMGDIGYFAIFGVVFLAWLMRRLWGQTPRAFVMLIAVLAAIPVWWEVAVRSTIIVNAVLVMAYLYAIERWDPRTVTELILAGIGGGLLLSTRSVFAIPLIIYFSYKLLRTRRWRASAVVGVSLFAAFSLTILPLYLWDAALFRQYNPLLVQSTLTSTAAVLGCLIVSAVLGLRSRHLTGVLIYSGLVIFGAALMAFIRHIANYGLFAAVHESIFDISYFSLALPFLLVAAARFVGPRDTESSRFAVPASSPRTPVRREVQKGKVAP